MLKSFKTFLKIKEDIDESEDNGALHDAVDIAWKMNKPKLLAILRDIAQEDENPKLNNLINVLNKQNTNDLNRSISPPQDNKRDELLPARADTGQGLEKYDN